MDTTGHVLAILIFGYLLGSIPFAKLFTMRADVDLFETGTGNPGAANVFRKVDKRIGAAVFIADALKGGVPVLIVWMMGAPEHLWIVAGASAVVGHWYPVFNKFRGGAGLATGAGAVVFLIPIAGAIGLVLGGLTIAKTKSSGHGAGVGIVVILGLAIPTGSNWQAMAGAFLIAAAVLGRATIKGWKPGRKD
ncbi:MAG: glycerol-3-phosphate acyltransferase [Dehalococcoidia bacterium]|jgi:glycerol-3-phosphate acyltransferase PlsY|nr:glycerol-3-phosphate acyltransferase [Dehalococcoidia bacterium]